MKNKLFTCLFVSVRCLAQSRLCAGCSAEMEITMNQNPWTADSVIEQKLDQYGDMLYRLAFSYVKNRQDAEDILQDVFLIYMEKQPVFETGEHEKAWFLRVTINQAKNKLRSCWMKYRQEWKDDMEWTKIKEESEVLQEVLKLPPKYKEVIHLYYYEGYSVSDIASLLQKKENTVKSLLKRGRDRLKKI